MPGKFSTSGYIKTLLLEENKDILIGLVFLLLGRILVPVNPLAGIVIGIGIGGYFSLSVISKLMGRKKNYYIGGYFSPSVISKLMGRKKNYYTSSMTSTRIQPANTAPVTTEETIADRIKAIHIATDFKCPSCGAPLKPTDINCKSCGSYLVASADLPKPARWGDVEAGRTIQITDPTDGVLNLSVKSRVYYGELWQARMRPDVPWTLTGNYYVSLELDFPYFLINWQERFFLTTSKSPLTDYHIQKHFAPPARQFAASNQTRDVRFNYIGMPWHMDDIGKFRIEYTDGEKAQADPGAVGRFIHASNGEKVLIVEDYESGGRGQDKAWFGVKIEEKDIKL